MAIMPGSQYRPVAQVTTARLNGCFRSMPFGPIGMAAGGIFGALAREPSLRKSSHHAEEMYFSTKQFNSLKQI